MTESPWNNAAQNREEQFQLKRDVLLRVAAKAFNEFGYHKTSVNIIAELLNVTKPTLYHYVKNKDDILFQIQKMAMDQILDTLEEVKSSDANGLEKLRTLLIRYSEVITDDFGRCLVLTDLRALAPASRQEMITARQFGDNEVRSIIKEGIQDGSIAPCDPKTTSFALFSALNGLAYWFKPGGESDVKQIAEQYLELFAKGLMPRD